jgi:hypothetical protein
MATNARSMLRERGSAIRCVVGFFFGWLSLGLNKDLDDGLVELVRGEKNWRKKKYDVIFTQRYKDPLL